MCERPARRPGRRRRLARGQRACSGVVPGCAQRLADHHVRRGRRRRRHRRPGVLPMRLGWRGWTGRCGACFATTAPRRNGHDRLRPLQLAPHAGGLVRGHRAPQPVRAGAADERRVRRLSLVRLHCVTPDVNADLSGRITRAQALMREAAIDVLLLSPGADLRYLSGYAAHPLERLTCLVVPAAGDATLVVPRLEQPMASASPAGSFLEIVAHEETDDAFALVGRLCGDVKRVGLANRMWAEQVLRLRATMPAAEQLTAGTVLRSLRMRKTPAEVAALREAGAAIDRVHARMGEWLRPGRTEAEV